MKKKYNVSISFTIETDETDFDALSELAMHRLYEGDVEWSTDISEASQERIRYINTFTGEVKETDACDLGVDSLMNCLEYDIVSSKTSELYEGIDIEQYIVFEGPEFFKAMLEKEFKKKLAKK